MVDSFETKISNLVESQFPSFYREQGSTFVAFVKAYYQWLEETGNTLYYTRRITDYRDIDNTIDSFLVHFQKKYLYGIPFDVIANKRLLLKHVLDVYRSKSSLQCFQLLFKLIYNEELDVYLPGIDVIRVSDGKWKQPRYLEITQSSISSSLVGKKIKGISSETTAIVESFVTEPFNYNTVSLLYLSNISPKGGSFTIGETIVDYQQFTQQTNLAELISQSPVVVGSLDSITIAGGGQDFQIGDTLKIARKSLTNNQIISFGTQGIVKVTRVARKKGQISFSISDGGFGFQNTALTFLYNANGDTTGTGASFDVGSLSDQQTIQYNTDCIANYLDTQIDSSSYQLPGNTSANSGSQLDTALQYTNGIFGSLASLTNVKVGQEYTNSPITFVQSILLSNSLPGTITYSTSSNTITGTSTEFDRYFQANTVIALRANSTANDIYCVCKQVVSNTQILLYQPPSANSTGSSQFRVGPEILKASFSVYQPIIATNSPLDANVVAVPVSGNGAIQSVSAIDSGKAYVEGEQVKFYRYNGISTPTIVAGGTGYANGEQLVLIGGEPETFAYGSITTNTTGGITSVTVPYNGSGYKSVPTITIKTANGSGANLTTTITEYNTQYELSGTVVKSGVGRRPGFWSTTDGHLNSDKYIQDSYFYQDFSYQLKAAVTLDKYREILYDTFHIAGSQLFGTYQLVSNVSTEFAVGYYSNTPLARQYARCDLTTYTADSGRITADNYLIGRTFDNTLTADRTIVRSDSNTVTADSRLLGITVDKLFTIDTSITADTITII